MVNTTLFQRRETLDHTPRQIALPRRILALIRNLCGLGVLGAISLAASPVGSTPAGGPTFLKPPLSFEANMGQVDTPIKYLARGPGYQIFLTPAEATIILHRPQHPASPIASQNEPPPTVDYATLQFKFVGAQSLPTTPVGHQPLSGKSHYYLGNVPTKWHTNVPHYAQVVYKAIYPDIDLIYYGQDDKLEYDLVVAPGGNPQDILLEIQGANRLSILLDGSLQIATPLGDLLQHPPILYQEQEGVRQPIPGAYRIQNNTQVAFDIGAYDPTRPLYIDPVLSYGSYIPSKGVNGIAIDQQNAIYITGAALPFYSAATNSLKQPPQGYLDIFVSKFDPTGTRLIYSAYLGGAWDDQGKDLVVDKAGNVNVVGFSSSQNFPIHNPFQFPNPQKSENSGSVNSGSYDIVVVELNALGNALRYSSYLGGCGEDGVQGNLAIARDGNNNVYLTGSTNSPDFPILNAFQPTYGRTIDTFVTKISSGGSLVYSTFLGGTDSDIAGDIEVYEEKNGENRIYYAYVVGTTLSPDFPTMNAFQAEIAQPPDPDPTDDVENISEDIFLTKFQPDGTGLVYSTYLGGEGPDEGHGLALNRSGQAFVTGNTRSGQFPGAPEQDPFRRQRVSDVIVSQFSASGTSLLNSTILGGRGEDTGLAIALDENRRVWVTGRTGSEDFPITETALQRSLGTLVIGDDSELPPEEQEVDTDDAFVLQLSSRGDTLEFSTYLGGDGHDEGRAIGVRILEVPPTPPSQGILPEELTSTLVVGHSRSSDFPRTAARYPLPSGGFLVDFLESDIPEDQEQRFPCPPFCFPIPLPNPPFGTTSFPPVTADLTITMEDTPDSVEIGERLDYTITVTNHGPNIASNVIVTDVLPPRFQLTSLEPNPALCRRELGNQALVCFLGSLTPDAPFTLTISGIPLATSFRVPDDDTEEADNIIPNRVSVFNDLPDTDYTNNSAAVFTEVIDPNPITLNSPLADLSVIKNDIFLRFDLEKGEQEIVTPEDPDPITNATVGRPFIYEITVTNREEVAITVTERDENGEEILDNNNNPIQKVEVVPTSAASNVILTDFLPPNLTPGFVTIDPPQGSCQGGLPDFRCFLGSLDPGATITLTIWVMPSTPEDIKNKVLVTTSTTEPPDRTPNTDTEDTAIQVPQAIEEADLLVTFTDEEELVLTEEDERDEDEDPPDPVDPDQQTGRGEVTWKLEVLNAGPDKALNVLVTSRINAMKITDIPPTTINHLDSIPPTPTELRESSGGKDTGVRYFQPLKGEIITADNIRTKCENGKTPEGEDCQVDGRFECTLCEEYSPLCVLCQGESCIKFPDGVRLEPFRLQAFSIEEEITPEGEPTGILLVKRELVEPEDIIAETILSELEDFDDQDSDHQKEIILSCNIGTLEAEEKFLLDFSLDLTQGIHESTAQATTLTFDPDLSSNESPATTTVAVPAGHPTRGGEGGNDGAGNSCFIATAAFGSPLAPEVYVLRKFRDLYLLPSTAGQLLVDTYYATSPPLAAFISNHPPLKALVQGALWPIILWVKLTLKTPTLGFTILWGWLMLMFCLIYWIIRNKFSSPS